MTKGMRRAARLFATASTFCLAAGGFAAHAQTADPGDQSAAKEIIVTGSRIARQGFDSPNPVTVFGSQDAQKLGLTSTSDIVAELPQNSAFVSSANVGQGNFNIGASLGNLRGLNPFYGTRTLTLVDGKRFVPTTDGGAVDLNVVPSILIKRVETVTGGASATYGSDAVAGVINILLDTKLTGFKAQVDDGATFHGDGGDYHATAAWGTAFAGDRGHVLLGGEYEHQSAIGRCGEVRSWCATNSALITNPGYATDGQPHYILASGVRQVTSSSGLFPLLGQQFNAAGTALVPYTFGQYPNTFGYPATQIGGADAAQDINAGLTLRPKLERYSLAGHLEYEFSDALHAYAEGFFAHRDAVNQQVASGASIFYNTISPDNVFLPASAAALLATTGPQPFTSNGDGIIPARTNTTSVKTERGVFGLNGQIGGSWGWDGYYTYGRNITHQAIANMQVLSYFGYALDAVANTNPALGAIGSPVCRQTLLGNAAAAGCVPINMFGTGNVSPAAIAYAYRTLHQDENYQQHVVSGSIHGDLFQGFGAGPIKIAAGAEYRHESLKVTHDQDEQPWYSSYELSYGSDFNGSMDVVDGFGELSVPVLKDMTLAKSLSFDGAIRETHNKTTNLGGPFTSPSVPVGSNSVSFLTWKASGIWDVNDWIRFRATRSRDARAASFFELFAVNTAVGGLFGSAYNPAAGNALQPITSYSGGSTAALHPEKADTWTVGTVLTGHGALRGISASIDWYQVKLHGPISELGTQNLVNACYTEKTFCQYITGTGALPGGNGYATITSVNNTYLNLGQYVTRGLDMEADYHLGLGGDRSLTFRVLGSYLYDMVIDTGAGTPVYNYAGISGPTPAFGYYNTMPKWQGNAFVTYANDRFSGTVQVRYIGSGKLALLDTNDGGVPYVAPGDPGYSTTLANSISSNRVPAAAYVNLSASYKIPTAGRSFELFGTINNVLDKKPPLAPGGNGYPTNPVYFDTFGASFKVGVRVQL